MVKVMKKLLNSSRRISNQIERAESNYEREQLQR